MKKRNQLNPNYYILVLFFLSVLVLASGGMYHQKEKDAIQKNKHQELHAIARLKLKDLTQWQKERLSEARFFTQNQPFQHYELNFLKEKAFADSVLIQSFQHIMTNNRYANIFLVSAKDALLYSVDKTLTQLDSITRVKVQKTIASGEISIYDFYLCPTHHETHFEIMAPIKDANQVLGVLVFRINPADYLFPVLQEWPTPSPTAESYLVRRDGDSVLFINNLRHISNKPLTFKMPLTNSKVSAVKAINGHTGIFKGYDYRGKKVLSDINPVPNTQWYLISEIDQDEIYADFYRLSSFIWIITLITILLFIILFAYLYYLRKSSFYKELYLKKQELFEAQEEFRATLYSIGDGVITTDRQGIIKQLNPIAEKLTGYSENEARGKELSLVFRIINETTRETINNPVDKVLKEGIVVGLANHTLLIAKDGTEIPIADSGSPIRNNKGEIIGVVLVFSDQTSERNQQQILIESEEKYRSLIELMQPGLALHEMIYDAEGNPVDYRFLEVNPAFEKQIGLRRDMLIGKTVLEVLPHTEKIWIERYHQVVYTGKPASFDSYARELKRHYNVVAYPHKTNQFVVLAEDISNQIQIEQTLKLSEKRYRQVVENISDVVWTTDIHFNTTFISPSVKRLLGEPAEVYINRSIEKRMPPQSIKLVQQILAEEMEKERDPGIEKSRSRQLELELYRADGSLIWIGMNVSFIRDWQGNPTGFLGVSRDISQLKKTELMLRESEERFRLLAENSLDGIMITIPDGSILSANQAACDMLGMTEEEICLKGRNGILDLNDPRLNQLLSKRETESKIRGELNFIHKNGTKIPVEITSSVFHNSKGEPRTSMIIRNISERLSAEKELRDREKDYREVINRMNETIWIIDLKGNLLDVNQTASELLGYSKEELLSIGLEGIDANFVPEQIAALIESMPVDKTQFFETLHKAKDGTIIPVEINSSLFSYQGQQHILSVSRDIRKRIALERNIIESEETIRHLLNSTAEGIYGVDLEGKCTFCNNAAIKLLGYEQADELIGKNMHRLIHFANNKGEKHDEADCNIFNAFKQSKGTHADNEVFWKKDDSFFFVEYWSHPIINQGKLTGSVVTFLDITERKKVQDALNENYTLLKIAGKSARFGGWSVLIGENRIHWSDEVAAIHEEPSGFSPTIEQGMNYYAPEWRDLITEAFNQCLHKGIPFDLELEIITAKKNKLWVRAIGQAQHDENNNIIKTFGSFQDISTIKKAEKELENSRLALIRLIENLSGIAYRCYFDPNWTMDFISNACQKLCGYSDQDFYQHKISWEQIIHEEDRELVRKEIADKIAAQENYQLEYRIIDKNKNTKWVWEKGGRINNANEHEIILEGFITDITERKAAEEELMNLKNNLEQKVNEKTRELNERIADLERFHEATIDRELRMKELRDEIERLKGHSG
jgi:PAS domain S-box-containing protein